MAALAIIIATLAGWYTARYRRARADHQGAKAGVEAARRILALERKMFALIAAIVIITIWWWLDSHS
jgi:hypothetical protein